MGEANLAKGEVNCLALVVVAPAQLGRLTRELREGGFYFTQIGSWGSLVEETTVCLLIGLAETRLPVLLALVRAYCQVHRRLIPVRMDGAVLQGQTLLIESESGGASVYTVAVERFVQL